MIINNPFKLNDWKFNDFIKPVLILQLIVLVLVGLRSFNLNIPIINELVLFVYLTFIPGFLILRILRVHGLDSIETILYAVGLSITSLMFVGFTISMIFPIFGVLKPITLINLTISITIFVLFLCIFSYFIDKKYPVFGDGINSQKYKKIALFNKINTDILFSPQFLFLCIVPFLAIFGSYFVTYYHNNLISMFLIALVGLILILVGFDVIPANLRSFAIWISSISLLYMSSLISQYVWGWDIQNEYYLASLVLKNFYWNSMLSDAYNSMLSIVILSPIYSVLTSMNLDQVFKIIYPFLFSLVPLGLYKIFKKETDSSKIAFLAVFLFISFNTFYIEMLSLVREMTGELFLVLLLLLIFKREYNFKNIALMIIFSASLVVSHYTLTFFFILLIIGVMIILMLFNILFKGITIKRDNLASVFTLPLITIFTIVFMYIWYGSFSQRAPIRGLEDVFRWVSQDLSKKLTLIFQKIVIFHDISTYLIIIALIILGLFLIYAVRRRKKKQKTNRMYIIYKIQTKIGKIFNYKVIAVLSIIILIALVFLTGPPKTWIVTVQRYLNYVVVFFAVTGLAVLFINYFENKFQKRYLAFSILAIGMLIAGILVPSFETSLNITRIYQLAFIFLSPLSVIGGMKIFGSILETLKRNKISHGSLKDYSLKIFAIFLLLFMLFNTGFFSVLSGQSIPLHLNENNGVNSASDYHPLFNHQESIGAAWLIEHKTNVKVYADIYGVFAFYRYMSDPNVYSTDIGVQEIGLYSDNNSYIYLRKLNQDNNLLSGFTSRTNRNRIYENMSAIIMPKNRIYENGASKIYYS